MLLVLEPLVKATFGNAKFLACSIFVAAVIVVVLENLNLPLSRVRSAFACWHSKRGTGCNTFSIRFDSHVYLTGGNVGGNSARESEVSSLR